MGVASYAVTPPARPRHVLLVGAFVVGWSLGRAQPEPAHVPPPVEPALPIESAAPASHMRRPVRLALTGVAVAVVLVGAGLAIRPGSAAAPLVDSALAAQTNVAAQNARLTLLRHLQTAGIADRRNGMPPEAEPVPTPVVQPTVAPSARAIALDNYIQALGTQTILTGLDASRDQLQQQVLHDPRVHIYPEGIGDVTSGKLDVRILAVIEYLAQADGEVSVSCLISGHSLYVAGRPGVVSAHIYGRAVDISAVDNVPILDHQGPGTITEHTIEQLLALPASVEPVQIISLMTLGGPSFALADHYNHIHIGY
ncbi:MAG TPA: hypothetical protein VLJ76_08260 [Gaiellaceae bacterium]|nr:hypothetical protein [Gaiellaceae bacterium]